MPPAALLTTLFNVGFKRKAEASGAELEEAASTRADQDAAGFKEAEKRAAMATAKKMAMALRVPADVPTCKKNLFTWLSKTVDLLNEDKSGVSHCWEETKLLQAWDHPVQVEATRRLSELFPKLAVQGIPIDVSGSADDQAGALGAAFTEVAHEEEWMEWVDWARVDAQTRGAGSSS